VIAQRAIPADVKRIASPTNTVNTPRIIGLRTYAYRLPVTSLRVGSQGARVPLPIMINIRIVSTIINSPSRIKMLPGIVVHIEPVSKSPSMTTGTITKTVNGIRKEIKWRRMFIGLDDDLFFA
jgi:hypothetical protein